MNKIKNFKQTPAKGTNGFLLYTFNGGYVFRVYGKDNTFTDYDIKHCDLELTITDGDAMFYSDDKNGINHLDYSYKITDDTLYNALEGGEQNSDKGYEIGTEEKYNEFVKLRNKQ
jgi:hypothetical protein